MTKPAITLIGCCTLIILGGFLLFPTSSLALKRCSCSSERRAPEQAFERSFSVFIGKVKRIKREFSPQRHKIIFEVEKSWKRVAGEKISVYSSGTDLYAIAKEGITCGFSFKKGEKYLVYSYRQKNRKGPAYVSRCSRTRPLKNATSDIRALNALGGEPILSDIHEASGTIAPR